MEADPTMLRIDFAGRNWGQMLQEVEKEIRKPAANTSAWKEDREFYSQCADSLFVFKDAWRNLTAHAHGIIGEQAGEMLEGSKAFLKRLATRLHE
jgi:hypothetical protein